MREELKLLEPTKRRFTTALNELLLMEIAMIEQSKKAEKQLEFLK